MDQTVKMAAITIRICPSNCSEIPYRGCQYSRQGMAIICAAVLNLPRRCTATLDRKSVVSGKSVSVRVDLGGRRIIRKKKHVYNTHVQTSNNRPTSQSSQIDRRLSYRRATRH